MECTSTEAFDKEKMIGKMEQKIIRKKMMRTILATYPPILDEQQSIPSETYFR